MEPEKVRREWRRVFERSGSPFGLYLHVPEEALDDGGRLYLRCLREEAAGLDLPRKPKPETLYIGSAGSGCLAALEPGRIAQWLDWLSDRFDLRSLKQFVVELDPARLTPPKARLLARFGSIRVSSRLPASRGAPEDAQRRLAFARGIELCREAGLSVGDIDPAGPWPDADALGRDLDLAVALRLRISFGAVEWRRLERDLDPAAGRLERRLAELSTSRRDANLQFSSLRAFSGTVLALGYGGVSYIRNRLIYRKSGSLIGYGLALIGGGRLPLAGAPMTPERAMRGFIVTAFADDGRLHPGEFESRFGTSPERAFPAEFAALLRRGRLARRDGLLEPAGRGEEDRLACARVFVGATIPRRPAGSTSAPGRALENGRSCADALLTRASLSMERLDWRAAERHLGRAVGLLGSTIEGSEDPSESAASAPARRRLARALSMRADARLRLGLRESARDDLMLALLAAPRSRGARRGPVEPRGPELP